MLTEPPVRLCCFQRHWDPPCPDGMTMCCLCFDRFEQADLFVDEAGDRWDMCTECGTENHAGRP